MSIIDITDQSDTAVRYSNRIPCDCPIAGNIRNEHVRWEDEQHVLLFLFCTCERSQTCYFITYCWLTNWATYTDSAVLLTTAISVSYE